MLLRARGGAHAAADSAGQADPGGCAGARDPGEGRGRGAFERRAFNPGLHNSVPRTQDEATSSFAPSLSVSAAKTDKCKNTGALGPLLVMIQNEQDTVKLRSCLDTLAFLLLDKANRRVINEIHGLDAIMGLFTRSRDPTVLCSALDAVCSLVRSDDADKVRARTRARVCGRVTLHGVRRCTACAWCLAATRGRVHGAARLAAPCPPLDRPPARAPARPRRPACGATPPRPACWPCSTTRTSARRTCARCCA